MFFPETTLEGCRDEFFRTLDQLMALATFKNPNINRIIVPRILFKDRYQIKSSTQKHKIVIKEEIEHEKSLDINTTTTDMTEN